MTKPSKPRPLNQQERQLLDFMLSADFPGCSELRAQALQAEVCRECDCGCGTIDFVVAAPGTNLQVRGPVAVEAHGKGVDVLLIVRNGALSSLEIVDHGDARPIAYPISNGLKLWVPPARAVLGNAPLKLPD